LEELRMLSNFQLGSHPLLQTLLLGQPEFRKTVANHEELEQLRQRVIASHHLSALEEDEVEEYVRYRLEIVGWNGNPEITDDVYSELFDATGGIPRRINQVMNRLLLLGSIEERAGFTVKMLDDVCAEMVLDSEQGSDNAAPAQTAMAAASVAAPMSEDMSKALADMAQRLDDQEASVRHVLTLLVEWFEEENQREAA
ncbi:MAG: hypothetical protein ABJX46_01470, partial [Erythrobacter sp.]